jgi:hypothetical protein
MPSVRTGRRAALPAAERTARYPLILVGLCLLLVGCSSGAAREAARDQAKDAGFEQRLAAEQATRTVQRYFPATATPAPTAPPAPSLRSLVITFGFRPDGTPDGSYASVPAGVGAAYAGAQLAGVSAGQIIRAVVTDGWGNEIARPEVTIDPGPADRWVALPIGLPPELSPGPYGVFLFAGERVLGSLQFGITGVGTSAQLLPEAPTNPQVRSTQPAPGGGSEQPAPTVAPST